MNEEKRLAIFDLSVTPPDRWIVTNCSTCGRFYRDVLMRDFDSGVDELMNEQCGRCVLLGKVAKS